MCSRKFLLLITVWDRLYLITPKAALDTPCWHRATPVHTTYTIVLERRRVPPRNSATHDSSRVTVRQIYTVSRFHVLTILSVKIKSHRGRELRF